VIAHRGASAERPENTMSAFLRALDRGAEAIELDVHATADGVVVVHHDPTVRQAPTRNAPVRDIASSAFEAIARLDVGDGERIPALASVLDAIGDRADVYVELKAGAIEAPVIEVIRASRAAGRCAMHSFDHRMIRRARAVAPDIPGGVLLSSSRLVDPAALLASADARDLWMEWRWIDAELVRAVQGAGGRVIAWTAPDRRAFAELATLGVDGICANDVAELVDTLGEVA
jgi:glycerophosphoryl diester phosphodiesterase